MKNIKAFIEIIEFINYKWETKIGLLIGIITADFISYFILKGLDEFIPSNFYPLIYFFCFILIAVLIFAVWSISTNRFYIKPIAVKIAIGVIVILDEEQYEKDVRRIIKNSLKKIEDFDKINGLVYKMLPINFISKEKELIDYLDNFSFSWDAIMIIDIEGGFYEKEEKIKINGIKYVARFDKDIPKQIFHGKANLIDDFRMYYFSNNWECIITNFGNDKKKILNNLSNSLLNFAGIYAIYLNEHKLSLQILKTIFQPEQRNLKGNINVEKKVVTFNLNNRNMAEARLAGIIIDLYFRVAFELLNTAQKKEALILLREAEDIIITHPKIVEHLIQLARLCWEVEDYEEAKRYNEKARKFNKDSPFVLINDGWFAIVENSPINVGRAYAKLINTGGLFEFNPIDLIDFWERNKEIMKDERIDLIDFAIGIVTTLRKDPIEGKEILLDVKKRIQYKSNFGLIKELIESIINRNEKKLKKNIIKKNK